MAAHARTAVSSLPRIDDAAHALCYHVLSVMACNAGATEWKTHGVDASRALARIAVTGKSADAFVRSLAELRDDVTERPLITSLVDTRNHGVVPLVESLFVAWLDDAADGDATFARVEREATDVRLAEPPALLGVVSVADVLTYCGVFDGVLAADEARSMPVCVDARIVGLLKKLTVLRVLTQYDEVYARETEAIDEFVDALADDPECSMAVCWDVISRNATDPVLWTCIKADFGALASACELVQADEATWRKEVIDRAYDETGIARWPPGDALERSANMYLAGELHEVIARTYGEQKLANPTPSQATTYLRLMMFRMRLARASRDTLEQAWSPAWREESAVPPHCMSDVVERAHGRGVVLQNAARTASFGLVAAGGGDALFLDAHNGEATLVAGGEEPRFDFDAMVLSRKRGARWRATILAETPGAARAAEERMCHMRALLESADKTWVE